MVWDLSTPSVISRKTNSLGLILPQWTLKTMNCQWKVSNRKYDFNKARNHWRTNQVKICSQKTPDNCSEMCQWRIACRGSNLVGLNIYIDISNISLEIPPNHQVTLIFVHLFNRTQTLKSVEVATSMKPCARQPRSHNTLQYADTEEVAEPGTLWITQWDHIETSDEKLAVQVTLR